MSKQPIETVTAEETQKIQIDQGQPATTDPDPALETTTVRVVDKRWHARENIGDGAEDRSSKPTFLEELELKLADKEKLLSEYAERYKSVTKEFEETRARLRKEVTKDVQREKRAVLTSFLEVLDNLDRAIQASLEAANINPNVVGLLEGVKMVRQQFLSTLENHGVDSIDAAGMPFDPNVHDAISVVPVTTSDRDGYVIEVVTPGYQIADEVLRPASVTVGKFSPNSE